MNAILIDNYTSLAFNQRYNHCGELRVPGQRRELKDGSEFLPIASQLVSTSGEKNRDH